MIDEKYLLQIVLLNKIISNSMKIFSLKDTSFSLTYKNYTIIINGQTVIIRNEQGSFDFFLFKDMDNPISDDFIALGKTGYSSLKFRKSYGLSIYNPNISELLLHLQTSDLSNIGLFNSDEFFQSSLLYNILELNAIYLYNDMLCNKLLDGFGLSINFNVQDDINEILEGIVNAKF